MKLQTLLCILTLLLSPSFLASPVFAACDDGRVPCSHPCDQNTRPKCKDSRGADGKPHCVTPGYCRDYSSSALLGCEAGWRKRKEKCSTVERASRGCKDKRAPNGDLCVNFSR